MQNNVDIFINAFSDFDIYPPSQEYKIIGSEGTEYKDKYIDVIYEKDDKFLPLQPIICEFTRLYWVYKNWELKDYIGFCQYRRYFSFFDKVPNMNEIFKEYDIITAIPTELAWDITTHYSKCHNIKDLECLNEVLKEIADEHTNEQWKIFIENKIFFTNNMFIMKKEEFIKYMQFMVPIVDAYIAKRGWNTYEDVIKEVENHKDEYLKLAPPNNTVEYQSRILAYLIERLTSFYIMCMFKNPKTYGIKLTEKKYLQAQREFYLNYFKDKFKEAAHIK